MKEKYKKIINQFEGLIEDNLIDKDGNKDTNVFETLQKNLEQDYSDLIDLRNRFEGDEPLYEEDYLTLDTILNGFERLINILRIIKE